MTILNEQMFIDLMRAMPDEQLRELHGKLSSEMERRGLAPEPREPEHERLEQENGK